MKKIFNIALVAAVVLFSTSCEDFLDSTNYWSKTTADFPQNPSDAVQMVTGIYNNLNVSIGNNTVYNYFLWANAAGDDCLGGGGNNDRAMQAEDLLMSENSEMYNSFYVDRYKGVARANLALETLQNCNLDETTYNQYMGEAYFMRAYYMYELASMFGNIPYPTSASVDATQPQVSGEVLWGQMMLDLKTAIEMMPAKKANGDGHVDKYCAQALLGRIYLIYSGFYGSETVTLPDESTLDKAYVAGQISDCVKNSGYDLAPKFPELWAYTNRCTVEDELSPYKGQNYKYVSNDGAVNPEAMFMIKFNAQPSWSTTIGYSNQYSLYMGVRGTATSNGECFPFGTGWGMCPVSPQLVADWKAAEPTDVRRDASIIGVDKFGSYAYGADSNIQESGFYQTKTMPVMARKEDGTFAKTYSDVMYTLTWDFGTDETGFMQLGSLTDLVLIRFAEVLLMDAELNGNQASFDRVRTRAGLGSKSVGDIENIRNERRWEFAFEALRLNDLRRYGESYAASALDKQEGVKVWNYGVESTNTAAKFNGGYGTRYKDTKGAFVAIPSSQINLSASAGEEYKYAQNPGWESADVTFPGW